MSDYKVGDLIKSKVDECDVTKGKVYKVTAVGTRGVLFLDDANEDNWLSFSYIEPAPKSLDNLQAGDVLVKRGTSSSRIVQGTMGEIVFFVYDDDGYRAPYMHSTTQLKKYGWELKDSEETREMTVKEVEELVGQKVKIVKEKE